MSYCVIGTVGVPACYGGFESLVENLLPSDQIAIIYCSSKTYKKHRLYTYKGARLCYIPLNPNGSQSVLYDAYSVLHALIFTKNDLLILGVSGAFIIPFARLLSRRNIITNIDGIEWRRSKWNWLARWVLRFFEYLAVKWSHKVIVDNKAIGDYVFQSYGVEGVLIEYGGDHAVDRFVTTDFQPDYAFSVCRIEPENNIDMILSAFSRQKAMAIRFVGNWNNSAFGRNLMVKFSKFPVIELCKPEYDIKILASMRSNCQVYIHGHSAGGTNPSLVEMMFFGVPILCFDCEYNRETTENRALYFSNENELFKLVEARAWEGLGLGDLMLEIAERRYRWRLIRKKYLELLK